MAQPSYFKQPFVWQGRQRPVEVPQRLTYRTVNTLEADEFIAMVAKVRADSFDRSDQQQVAQQGAEQATRQFLAEAKGNGFFYQEQWWQVGIDSNGHIVGFVLPVIYEGYAKDGLEEATLYYIGVLPKHRRQGYGVDLLLAGTKTLQEIGVWRIFCDTDVQNKAMIAAFERAGYERTGGPYERPL